MIEQAFIMLAGLSTVFLSQSTHSSRRRWACVIGLCAQPFWFYAAWKAEQWCIVAMAFVYTAGWARGFYTFWLRRAPA